jgi:hypothetical protein
MNKIEKIHQAITKAVECGNNILIEGGRGVGKSSITLQIAEKLGLRLKYFSAPTLDPIVDFVGIPVPVIDEGARRIVYLRPDAINQAEIIFFDELNRAQPKTLNAVFELVQFRSINGEKLPHLRSIIGAVNPAGERYHVQDLDPALIDRFHIYLRVNAGPDRQWFVKKFGTQIGHALLDWYETDLDDKQRQETSNRRLEYIGLAHRNELDLELASPPSVQLPLHLLQARLREDEGAVSIEQFVEDPNKFAGQVGTHLNIAIRFAELLPMMTPTQKGRVSEILLALPAEVLAMLRKKFPFVFQKVRDALANKKNKGDADAFWELLQERLRATG